jgi:transposase
MMARYKRYDYRQTVMLAVSLENQLVPGTLEFAIQMLVERRIDTSIFGNRYKNDETGCPAYDPQILLKVILFAYSRGIIASRKIEQACRENSPFMALACGIVPDHSTIATFVSSMKEELREAYQAGGKLKDWKTCCERQIFVEGLLEMQSLTFARKAAPTKGA